MRWLPLGATAALLILLASPALAEPHFAVATGYTCGMCHVNPTGGGLRTPLGNVYAQNDLAARPNDGDLWTGVVAERFGVGANARVSARSTDIDGRDDNLDFAVDRATLYVAANLNRFVTLYLDQQVAPGGSLNREAWVKVAWGKWYAKAGNMFLPFGWRLQDDSAFVRSITGINMTGGDNGVEVGFQDGAFNVQLAASNGTGGAQEIDDGKAFNLRGEWVRPKFRLGLSASRNSGDVGKREMYGAFAGVKTGFVHWLFEYDRLEDSGFTEGVDRQAVALVEANVGFRKGHNVKLSFEAHDLETDDRFRLGVVYEYSPLPFTQLRAGVRGGESDAELPRDNGQEYFVQLHGFF